jgi:hypothetical protein
MAAEKPIVMTNIPSNLEIASSVAMAILVEPDRPRQIADAIVK